MKEGQAMNRAFRFWISGALAIALVVTAILMLSQISFAHETTPAEWKALKSEVILMRCKSSGGLGIKAYKGSPGTPVKKSSDCAENLSLLMKDGFVIHDIGHYDDVDDAFVLYTLIR
jgi:hypothetical protein